MAIIAEVTDDVPQDRGLEGEAHTQEHIKLESGGEEVAQVSDTKERTALAPESPASPVTNT